MSCEHCGFIGRQFSIVDSEQRACELRISEGSGKKERTGIP